MSKLALIALLFSYMNDQSQFYISMTPLINQLIAQTTFADEESKQKAVTEVFDRYYGKIKESFIIAYDKCFTESEITELLNFYSSTTGKKYTSETLNIAKEMGPVYSSLMPIVQEVTSAFAIPVVKEKQENIIDFDDVVQKVSNPNMVDIFNELVQDGLTIIKFSAEWCPPCKVYAPLFEKAAGENASLNENHVVKYIVIDINRCPEVAQQCNVLSIPTTVFFKDGKQLFSKIGVLQPKEIFKQIEEIV